MQAVYLFIYLILITITWYAIGMEKTRNSSIRMQNIHLAKALVEYNKKEESEYEAKVVKQIILNMQLIKTTSLLTLMGLIFLGIIIYSSIINCRYGWDISIWFILLIVLTLDTAITSYINGCKRYLSKNNKAEYEMEHIARIVVIGFISKVVEFIELVLFIVAIVMCIL